MAMPLLSAAEAYITERLMNGLGPDHQYHNLQHTLEVTAIARQLGQMANLPPAELEILSLAALFHDTGFVLTYTGHELASRQLAREFLETQNYPSDHLEQVLRCIDATAAGIQPSGLLECILCDADLSSIGRDQYLNRLAALRHEWEVFRLEHYTDEEWYRLNYRFLKKQNFYTPVARKEFAEQHAENTQMLKSMAKKTKNTEASEEAPLSNRTAQMIFKTALRNHIDLSNLADNKANIMLSVNAGIIAISVPLAGQQMQQAPYLMIPLICLLVTCLTSMLFATLATRPIKMAGTTSPEQIKRGESNLFFFGNFFGMSYNEYKEGIQVILNDGHLNDSIMRDLFFLGKSLGTKYRQLRACYLIFMVGIALTVASFLVAFTLTKPI